MNIEGIIWLNQFVDKLAFKHQVEIYEVEEVLSENPKFRCRKRRAKKRKYLYGFGANRIGQILDSAVYLQTN